MAKANITLPDGTKVTIEGTTDEVAILLSRFSGTSEAAPAAAKKKKRKKKKSSDGSGGAATKRKGPQTLIMELAKEDYFKSKRTIGDIQSKLEEKGHIYAQHSLSSPLLRLTRIKTLRRLKEKNVWVYVS